MVVAVSVVALLVLGGLATLVIVYLNVHRDGGVPPTGAQLDPRCDAVSEQTRQRLRTTNPDPDLSGGEERMARCAWQQTKGVDGEGRRHLEVQIISGADRRPRCAGEQLPPPQLGQEACLGARLSGNITDVTLQVRQGGQFVLVSYSGWDVGFLGNEPAPVRDFANAVAAVGAEVLDNLTAR
ncbi:hypothetical protein SAMN05421810_105308 [Amycolatopsis arida]|uniref:DUF3558 domain-containing protein n=1 Tax=Amycolatopsis arida TaxID=587909 RepID=A0A1I5WWL3_9PSEU|nr:hypothetical protein [Amycolatopsis arida]TDX92482.1 hypothetical protein CLV69_105327 [Amycolatopsis arida]SFQ23937.1 hypothetical protein SAMN05421810_105308 [Amycolatopsis arida]